MSENIIDNSVLEDYRDAMGTLVTFLAQLNKFADKVKKGEPFERALFVYSCERICYAKRAILDAKAKMGFTDKFTFLEDNNFIGFSIKDGRLIRDEGVTDKDIFKICDKWFYGFPATANHYQFEVASYVCALVEVDLFGEYGYYPEDFIQKLGLKEPGTT